MYVNCTYICHVSQLTRPWIRNEVNEISEQTLSHLNVDTEITIKLHMYICTMYVYVYVHTYVGRLNLCGQVCTPPLLCAQSLYAHIFAYRMYQHVRLYSIAQASIQIYMYMYAFEHCVCHLTVCNKYLLNFPKLSEMELIKKSITKLSISLVAHSSCCMSMALRFNCHRIFIAWTRYTKTDTRFLKPRRKHRRSINSIY